MGLELWIGFVQKLYGILPTGCGVDLSSSTGLVGPYFKSNGQNNANGLFFNTFNGFLPMFGGGGRLGAQAQF